MNSDHETWTQGDRIRASFNKQKARMISNERLHRSGATVVSEGERIREQFIRKMDPSLAIEVLQCGGVTNTAEFWIENQHVLTEKMTARNIVSEYRGLQLLKEKHRDTLARSGDVSKKNIARKEISDYRRSCEFVFP